MVRFDFNQFSHCYVITNFLTERTEINSVQILFKWFYFKDREKSLFNPASREQVVGTGKLSGSRSCSINPRATWPLLFAIF